MLLHSSIICISSCLASHVCVCVCVFQSCRDNTIFSLLAALWLDCSRDGGVRGGGGIPDRRVQCCRLVCRYVGAALPETRKHRPPSGHSPRVDVNAVCQHSLRVVSTSFSPRVDVSAVLVSTVLEWCQHLSVREWMLVLCLSAQS